MKYNIQHRKTSVVKGSLADIARMTGKSVAETFVDAECITIIDSSGSMNDTDTPTGASRYTVACRELEKIQERFPGKVAVIAFSTDANFCPGGVPTTPGGGTDMGKALEFTKIADIDGMKFILISDGEPNDSNHTLGIAKTYKCKIDTIFVGSEGGAGSAFLRQLANSSGGQTLATGVDGLGEKMKLLLTMS